MALRYGLIALHRLDLWRRLGLGLDLGPEGPLRIGLPLLPVATLLPVWTGLHLNRGDWRRRLNRRRLLPLLPVLPHLSFGPGLRRDRSRGLGGRGRCRWCRLNLSRGLAAASALILSPVGHGLLLPRIGRPVLAAAPMIRLGQSHRRPRKQDGGSGRDKKRFHESPHRRVKGGFAVVSVLHRKRAGRVFDQ